MNTKGRSGQNHKFCVVTSEEKYSEYTTLNFFIFMFFYLEDFQTFIQGNTLISMLY